MENTEVIRRADMNRVIEFLSMAGPYNILSLFATIGFGRSKFLQNIHRLQKRDRPVALVHISDYASTDQTLYRLDDLLYDIVKQFHRSVGGEMEEPVDENKGLAVQIATLVATANRRQDIPLLLLDDYDQMPIGSRNIFDDLVLSKLLEPPRQAVVILSSEQEIRFTDRFDLRVRLTSHQLQPVTGEDIIESFPEFAALADELIEWTAGLPDMLEHVVKQARQYHINDERAFHEHKAELFEENYRHLIEATILPTPPQLPFQRVVEVTTVVRRFDFVLLRELFSRMDRRTATTLRQRDYLSLVRCFGSRVYWRDQNGYALQTSLRQMMMKYLREREPSEYEQIQQVTADVYRSLLEREEQPIYLVEYLYHRNMLLEVQGMDKDLRRKQLSKEAELSITRIKTVDKLIKLQTMLTMDKDLQGLIEQRIFNTITRRLDQSDKWAAPAYS